MANNKYIVIILILFFVIAGLSALLFLQIQKDKLSEENSSGMKAENFSENVQDNEPPLVKEEKNEVPQEVESDKSNMLVEYENINYKYRVLYPENWHMNNDDSGSVIAKIENEDGFDLKAGGQTFWSNYPNINDFSPSNKPEDFHLLGLTIYQDPSPSVDEFAKKLGYIEDFGRNEFQTASGPGIEFISAGLSQNNPKVSIIFRKSDYFFVFRPAFIGGDEAAGEIMGNIAKSFQTL